jgi:threonylcarbamoyladenosine tRNA methylthiotransferase MtaB
LSVEVINFGCRLNIAEGEAIRAAAGDADDLIVINSCAVTAEATRQARQAIRRAAKRRPDARIVVTGCAAEVDPAMFAGMAEVVSNRAKGLASSYNALRANGLSKPAISGADHARLYRGTKWL